MSNWLNKSLLLNMDVDHGLNHKKKSNNAKIYELSKWLWMQVEIQPSLSTDSFVSLLQELEDFQPYPVEILPAKLYMGNLRQACDRQIQKDLKIKAQVNISEDTATL